MCATFIFGQPTGGRGLNYSSPQSSASGQITGTINGVNAVFTLSTAPIQPGCLLLFRNGVFQFQSASGDYTISGNTITFNAGSIPQTGDLLVAL